MIKELFCQQNVFGSHDLAILRVIREVQDFPRALRLCETTPSSACCREYTFLYFAIFYMFFSLLLERDNFFFSLHTLLYSAGSLSLGMSLKDLLIVPLWARLDCATALLFFLWFDNYNQVLKDQVHVSCSTPAGRNQGKCAQNMAHDLGCSSVSNLDINPGFTIHWHYRHKQLIV